MAATRGDDESGAARAPDDRTAAAADWRQPFPRLPRYLVLTAGVLTLLSITLPNIAPGVDFLSADGSPTRMFFGVSEEANLPTFLSVLVTTAAAATQALVGRLVGGRAGKAFYVTAALLLAMAFDDFAALHERLQGVGAVIVGSDTRRYLWVIPGLVPAFVVLFAFRQLARSVRGRARRDLVLGVVVVLVAALGLESINGFLDQPGTNGPPLQIGTHLEEFCEDLGLILVLRGSLAMLEVMRSSVWCLRPADSMLAGRA